jgi:hypothetical protein
MAWQGSLLVVQLLSRSVFFSAALNCAGTSTISLPGVIILAANIKLI